MIAQQKEKAERHKLLTQAASQQTTGTDRVFHNRNASGGPTADPGYDNRGLDLKNDSLSNNTEETSLPEVQYRNGRVRQRQLSNQRATDMAESAT